MKKDKNTAHNTHMRKLNVLIVALIAFSIATILCVWVVFDYKRQQLEKEIYLLK